MKTAPTSENGIYYFLGNITSHITHALPLYKELGGTFVVLSEKARKELERYDIPVINLDDIPYQLTRFGYKIKPIYHYSKITKRHKKTIDFLNAHARIVLFYELYDFDPSVRLLTPKTVFLTHGNMLKDYMGSGNRVATLDQYDYMAAIGPYLKNKLIHQYNINPKKLVDLGIARTDEIIESKCKVTITAPIRSLMPPGSFTKIVSYLPTFWGASSIYNTGLAIVRGIPSDTILLFRPHPQTPKKILNEYFNLAKNRPNIIFLTEDYDSKISLTDIFKASSIIVGDVSSVTLEAILAYKPLVFAYDTDNVQDISTAYKPIQSVIRHSETITDTDVQMDDTLNISIKRGVDEAVWKQVIDSLFFHADGSSVKAITDFIKKL